MQDIASKSKSKESSADKLDPDKLCNAIQKLQRLVKKRFPKSTFYKTTMKLSEVAEKAKAVAKDFGGVKRAIWWTVIIIAPIALLFLMSSLLLIYLPIESKSTQTGLLDYSETIGLFVDWIILSVLGSLAIRKKYRLNRRKPAMQTLHQLRSIAHLIDLTQHNKNYQTVKDKTLPLEKRMSAEDCIRYLNYSSQALSLTGKVAAIMIEDYNDSGVIAAVCELDTICNGISVKIWQKIETLQQYAEDV